MDQDRDRIRSRAYEIWARESVDRKVMKSGFMRAARDSEMIMNTRNTSDVLISSPTRAIQNAKFRIERPQGALGLAPEQLGGR